MALYYDIKDHDSDHILQKCVRVTAMYAFQDQADDLNRNAADCLTIQADGDELKAIRHQFANIRMHNSDIVRWVGEDAVFIALNLS